MALGPQQWCVCSLDPAGLLRSILGYLLPRSAVGTLCLPLTQPVPVGLSHCPGLNLPPWNISHRLETAPLRPPSHSLCDKVTSHAATAALQQVLTQLSLQLPSNHQPPCAGSPCLTHHTTAFPSPRPPSGLQQCRGTKQSPTERTEGRPSSVCFPFGPSGVSTSHHHPLAICLNGKSQFLMLDVTALSFRTREIPLPFLSL